MSALKVGEEAVLVPASRQPIDPARCYRLNDVGAFVWERIDGRRTVSEIASSVCREFSVEALDVRADVDRFLHQLAEIGAVSIYQPDGSFEGESSIH